MIFPEHAEPPEDTGSPFDPTPEERGAIDRAALVAGWSLAEEVRAGLRRKTRQEKLEAARREAAAMLAELQTASREERRQLIRIFPAFRSPALVAALGEASVQAASDTVAKARELADLALFVARRLPGRKRRRLRAEAFGWALVANALRVATDFDGADRAFARAWVLWGLGVACDPELFPEWRMLDLEASLRRAQHRFAEALEILERALAASDAGSLATARLLVKESNALQQFGDHAGALAALEVAAPAIEASQDPHLLLRLRFNTAVNLCYLEKFAAAEKLLPEVRELAIEQGRELDLERVVWLSARLASGQGRVEKAITLLEQVVKSFTAGELPYEAGLASLDLAILYLKEGCTAEVRQLAIRMGWIFKAKGINREALAALGLFCEAARQETATVELTKRVITDVEKAQRSASPS
jgi:tetratricopeptide (TPR) repeat protein